jgi:integrase
MVDAADKVSPEARAIVLLGGDAGLRLGEILGLDQADVDRRGGRLTPRRSVFVQGKDRHEDEVKGGLAKPVPMSSRLADALKALRGIMARVETLAGLPGCRSCPRAGPHVLFAPCHGRGTSDDDQGFRPSLQPQHNPPLHAPVALSQRRRHHHAHGLSCGGWGGRSGTGSSAACVNRRVNRFRKIHEVA